MSTADLLRATAPHAPDRLRARVEAARPIPQRRRVRPVLVLAAAAVLAVAAAVVHGFATSAPQEKQISHGAAASAGVTTQSFAAAAPHRAAPKDIVALPPRGRLTHTDASIRVRVANAEDLGAATNRATRVATSLGGYAQSVRYRTLAGGSGASYLELRVPADKVKTALTRLANLGVLLTQQISIEDLTAKLQLQSDEIAQLRRRVAALNEALRNAALPESQRVLLQIKLAESKRALAQRLHGRKGTLAAGAASRISLVLTTQKRAAVAAPHRGRLGRMLHDAVGFLAVEAMVVLFALIVASPFVLGFGLLWFWRRRATERLLME
jgi:Domain of unknown function (DUF4349)